jgi:hypothetical protein
MNNRHGAGWVWGSAAALAVSAAVAHAGWSESLLPIGRSWAGDRELPLPFGVSATVSAHTRDYDLEDPQIMPLDPAAAARVQQALAAGAEQNARVSNRAYEENVMLDVWLLPFLNVFGLVGNVNGTTHIDTGGALGSFDIAYNGLLYGGGAALSAGLDRFFGSVAAILTGTALDVSDSSVTCVVVTPTVGLRLDHGACWVGAMYQRAEEHHEGQKDIPLIGPLAYDVDLKDDAPGNFVTGLSLDLSRHWVLSVEAGLGEGRHILTQATYRF